MNRTIKACLLAGALAAGMLPVAALAQQRGAYATPRTAYGTPDLQGVWTNVTLTPLERPARFGERKVLTPEEVAEMEGAAVAKVEYENQPTDPSIGAEDHTNKNCQGAAGRDCGYNAGWKDATTQVMRVGGEPRTSIIVSTPNGRMPPRIVTQNAAQRAIDQREADNAAGENAPARIRAGQNDNPEGRSLGERCIISFGNNAGPPMLPNGYYNNNIRIVQGKDSVAILVEMNHDVRVIRIGGEHRKDGVRPWFGDSVGRWEGDTLVVESKNFHPSTSFRGASENLSVTERFTRTAPDRLRYSFTISDPTIWAEPWTGEYEFSPTNGDVYEYACHEGNYGLEGILAGARAEEEAAAAAGAAASSVAR